MKLSSNVYKYIDFTYYSGMTTLVQLACMPIGVDLSFAYEKACVFLKKTVLLVKLNVYEHLLMLDFLLDTI